MRVPARVRDLALAAGVTAVAVTDLFVHGHALGPAAGVLAAALLVASGAALAVRRRYPLVTLLVAASGTAVLTALQCTSPTASLAPVVALYTIGAAGGRARSVVVAGLGAAGAIAVRGVAEGWTGFGLDAVAHATLGVTPVVLGEVVRMQRARTALLRERAEIAARAARDAQRLRVEEERRRIARDLHDVVAHALTTISVQSGVAAHLLDTDPEFARESLTTITAAARTALHELRGIVGVLRDPGPPAVPGQPGPGIDQVADLVEGIRRDGLDVRLALAGGPIADVPESVQVATYRIVQESLTNVRRHAGDAATTVSVDVDPDAVRVVVQNAAGRPGAPSEGGAGLLGMSERAELLGGELRAGPTADGFAVRARLPYGDTR